jgi:hypothetical protein
MVNSETNAFDSVDPVEAVVCGGIWNAFPNSRLLFSKIEILNHAITSESKRNVHRAFRITGHRPCTPLESFKLMRKRYEEIYSFLNTL